jgi:diadenosine tetraphosphate (Ap4A) HIT family hydrolase
MTAGFELHEQLAKDSHVLGDFPLCRLLLADDSQYPWFILVPRRAGIREIYELDETDRAQFWRESADLSRAAMQAFQGHKLNVAALGNAVPQLHVHHVVRYRHDPAWPTPIWGRLPPKPYAADAMRTRIEALRAALPAELAGRFRGALE